MVRRTINLPDDLDWRVRVAAEDRESYSAAVARLVDETQRQHGDELPPDWIGAGTGGPSDLGTAAEKYLREAHARPDD